MDDAQLLRYSRHLLLNEFGVDAQQMLLDSQVLVIGAGGLGSAALMYLASAGVGQITIADGDVVDLTNLQRQIIHREDRVGMNKAQSAKQTLATINAEIKVNAVMHRLAGDALAAEVTTADLVLDCSDNFATRYAVNSACLAAHKPLVSGAGIRFEGQISSFDFRRADSPCYECLFPHADSDAQDERCSVMGVFAPLVGIVGAMQAAEAIRLLTGVGEPLQGRLLRLEGLAMKWHSFCYDKDPQCAVCNIAQRNQFAEKEYVAA